VPVVPGEIMLKANMDYDSVSKIAGSMLGSGRGDRDGRDHRHGQGAAT
jgi:predicted transcriptional regulator